MLAPTMIESKKKTPKEWIAERKWREFLGAIPADGKWREFLGAIPADGKPHTYTVPHPNDLMTIRVTAAQVKTSDRCYEVKVDLIRRKAKILVKDGKEDS